MTQLTHPLHFWFGKPTNNIPLVDIDKIFLQLHTNLAKVPHNVWLFAIKIFLVFCLSLNLANLFWVVVPSPSRLAVPLPIAENPRITTLEKSPVDIAVLKSLAVFGKAAPGKNDNIIPVEEIASNETQLNLALVGIMSSNIENSSRAIIAIGNQQDIYAANSPLSVGSNVKIAKVLVDRIIINNNGKYETLYFDQGESALHKTAALPMVDPAKAQAMQEWLAVHQESEETPKQQYPTVYHPDQAITAMERAMPSAIAMSALKENGKMLGFKLAPGQDTEKFKELGLQPNDIVVAINGWPMSNSSQVMEMYQNLGDSNSANLQIKRGATVLTVSVSLQ